MEQLANVSQPAKALYWYFLQTDPLVTSLDANDSSTRLLESVSKVVSLVFV